MITLIPKGNNVLYVKDPNVGNTYVIKPPIFSLKDMRGLKKRSVVIGIVGARGSGKSVNGARLAIVDFFLKGVTNVWSNMDIGFHLFMNGKLATLHSNPIDKLTLTELATVYSDGLIFFDEVNMAIADSRRATAKGTLAFDYVVQQLRKRRLNIIWTAQSEGHVEMRLREQTDVFIKCTDVSLTNPKCGMGELTHCKCYDYAGIVNSQLPDKNFDGVFKTSTVWNKPWWNSYSTWQLQGLEQEKQPIEESVNTELDNLVAEIEQFIREKEGPVKKEAIWARWSIRDKPTKKQLTDLLNERGIIATDCWRKFVAEEYSEYARV